MLAAFKASVVLAGCRVSYRFGLPSHVEQCRDRNVADYILSIDKHASRTVVPIVRELCQPPCRKRRPHVAVNRVQAYRSSVSAGVDIHIVNHFIEVFAYIIWGPK